MKKTLLIVCGLLLMLITSSCEKDYRIEQSQSGTKHVHPDHKKKTELYVSVKGKDQNPGTKRNPFATIQRAQKAVGELIKKGLDSDVRVNILAGQYHLDKTLEFGPEDSGNKNYSVTYAASKDRGVVVTGGKNISGWKRVSGNLWVADLPQVKSGKWYFRELYADGRHLIRSRYPNKGERLTVMEIDPEDLTKIKLSKPVEISNCIEQNTEMFVYNLWATSNVRVNTIDGINVHVQNPVGWIGHAATEMQIGRNVFFESAREFIDQPDEWFLDAKAGKLYYQAAKGANPKRMKFTAPNQGMERLIIVEGLKKNPVINLHFENINFEYSWWELPKQGFNDLWAGHYGERYMKDPTRTLPGAIHFTYAEQCSMVRCRVAHTAVNGVTLGAGSNHNKILGCEFDDVGGNPVYVGWQPMYDEPPRKLIEQGWKDDTDAPSYNEIAHNYIHDSCTVIPGCTGLFVAFSPNTRIAHNEICNLPYTGISIGAIWTDKETVQKNCLIEYNYVHHYNQTMHDSGGLYTLGRQDGTLFRNNVVHDSKNAHGIYTDEGSSFITFENNIVYNSGKFNYHHHHGHDNLLRNNILATPGRACVVRLRNDDPKSFSMFNNIFWMDGGAPFELRVMHNKPDNGKYVFDHNIYWSTKAFFILFHNHYPLALWREEFKQDEHSIIVDPEFRDPKNGDFTLSPDSPAIAAGFKPIDTSRVGPQKPYDEVLNGYEGKR